MLEYPTNNSMGVRNVLGKYGSTCLMVVATAATAGGGVGVGVGCLLLYLLLILLVLVVSNKAGNHVEKKPWAPFKVVTPQIHQTFARLRVKSFVGAEQGPVLNVENPKMRKQFGLCSAEKLKTW